MNTQPHFRFNLKLIFTLALILGCMSVIAQVVHVPDPAFKAALVANATINTNGDSEIQLTEASAYTGTVGVSNKGISSLTGIEKFTSITGLNCAYNHLTELDVSANILLKQLRCNHNQLSTLDVSANTALLSLECYVNPLGSLSVANNPALTSLKCWNNQLISLDLGEISSLKDLRVNHNYLTSLDLGTNNLEVLYAYNNKLNAIDVTSSTQLTDLRCNVNKLQSLDLTENTLLTNLNCSNNKLAVVDLSSHMALTAIEFMNNELVHFNIQNGNNTLLTVFNTVENPYLECIQVDDPSYSSSEWTQVDATTEFSTVCDSDNMEIVYFPDPKFKSGLLKNHTIDQNGDKQIQVSEAEAYTGTISVRYAGVTDLTGIEAFLNLKGLIVDNNLLVTMDLSANTELEHLDFNNNDLTSLDLSNNSKITYISCGRNQVSSLNVTDKPALRELHCDSNGLTELDLSTNTLLVALSASYNSLTELDITANTQLSSVTLAGNQLTALDVHSNTSLTWLYCADNLISSLDIQTNTLLVDLFCFRNRLTSLNLKNGFTSQLRRMYATDNPDLTCIQVDDVDAASENNGFEVDSWAHFSTDCLYGEPVVYIPDTNFKNELLYQGYDTNGDGKIQVSEAEAEDTLFVADVNISDLSGIEAFVNLVRLLAFDNNVSSIDLSPLDKLLEVDLSNNNLNELILPSNLERLYAQQNSTLECIQVSDVAYAEANWRSTVDEGVAFSIACDGSQDIVYIPDTNFKNELLYQGYDTNGDGEIQVSEAEAEDTLFIADVAILDLTGIEAFVNLVRLLAFDNGVSSIDLSALDNLYEVDLSNNRLEELILPANLQRLYAQQNSTLECIQVGDVAYAEANWRSTVDEGVAFSLACDGSLDFVFIPDTNFKNALLGTSSINTNGDAEIQFTEAELFTSMINVNSLKIEDLTGIEEFTNITDLRVHNNRLSDLNVSYNTKLVQLHCQQNRLFSLDITPNTSITKLRCFSNELTSLNIRNGNNHNFQLFDARNNDLTCIEVDDVDYATVNFTSRVDPGVVFSQDCSGARIAVNPTTSDLEPGITGSVFPNPFSDKVSLVLGGEESKPMILVYDLIGRAFEPGLVTFDEQQMSIDLGGLQNGLYILQVDEKKHSIVKE